MSTSSVTAEILTGAFADHNTFENKDAVSIKAFTDFEKTADGFVATLPACSVVKFIIS